MTNRLDIRNVLQESNAPCDIFPYPMDYCVSVRSIPSIITYEIRRCLELSRTCLRQVIPLRGDLDEFTAWVKKCVSGEVTGWLKGVELSVKIMVRG